MAALPIHFFFFSFFFFLFHLQTLTMAASPPPPLAKPGCQDLCGNISIPYPFGMGDSCYFTHEFSVTCNTSSNPNPKPYLTTINLELLEISLQSTTVRVNGPVISSNCQDRTSVSDISLSGSPFFFSDNGNRFTALGCDNLALIYRQATVIGGCLSICNVTVEDKSCYGINCCQTSIPPYLKFINASLRGIDTGGGVDDNCRVAFMVDKDWFASNRTEFSGLPDFVPMILEWGIGDGVCNDTSSVWGWSDMCGMGAHCSTRVGVGTNYECYCAQGFHGNPYLSCEDINECEDSELNNCEMICENTVGSYNCSCPKGYAIMGNGCYLLGTDFYSHTDASRLRMLLIIGIIGGIVGLVCLVLGSWFLYKLIKRRKAAKLRQKFFKRNGGLLLQQQLSSADSNTDTTKMFSSKELEKATDHYNQNRILGQGGQGTVYKGMLTDGRIVAVKKSKIVDESKLAQFINEVVILSQVNHRNVVKLLGCCLETDVPLLVYEFVPNGTLFRHLQDSNEEFPITWEMRLRIATEVGNALSYLHSAASIPIYHRDIKSTNILLDEKYRAKVSDFGTSKSIEVDQTHATTRVQGTFGYLDPEYFQSSQFTEKSDVYSFGVVLVELITGQKPISSARSVEERSLATYFLITMEQNRLFEIVDSRVLKEGGKEEIKAVAKLARSCLNLNRRNRPTMRTVVMELERIRGSSGTFSTIDTDYREMDFCLGDYPVSWDEDSCSMVSYSNSSTVMTLPSDGHPLLSI
ncbi:Wall-associated kinase family protein [Euphorbia peplus]|nr:Wall-associated kinase family protein [Euphorbia peplus]